MSRSRQTLLGRLAFSALVAASLTFGGVQALAGSSTQSSCASGLACATRPFDSACAAMCQQQYPQNGGSHVCVGGCCTCNV